MSFYSNRAWGTKPDYRGTRGLVEPHSVRVQPLSCLWVDCKCLSFSRSCKYQVSKTQPLPASQGQTCLWGPRKYCPDRSCPLRVVLSEQHVCGTSACAETVALQWQGRSHSRLGSCHSVPWAMADNNCKSENDLCHWGTDLSLGTVTSPVWGGRMWEELTGDREGFWTSVSPSFPCWHEAACAKQPELRGASAV